MGKKNPKLRKFVWLLLTNKKACSTPNMVFCFEKHITKLEQAVHYYVAPGIFCIG